MNQAMMQQKISWHEFALLISTVTTMQYEKLLLKEQDQLLALQVD
jgi:hypothetical protein